MCLLTLHVYFAVPFHYGDFRHQVIQRDDLKDYDGKMD